tara:strand:+ start:601 stop:2121 length:1521 start_codon:yes stop_codon:yes gene_type:complete
VRLVIALFFLIAYASADEIVLTPTVSENLLPGISSFMTSGDATMTGDGSGCQPGEACTGAAGGIYSTTVDFTGEMTIAEINAGFDLAYGVTVDSHSSNASLPTCDQTGGDCQDNFNLTLTLQDGTTVVEKYEHDFVLDYANLREYQFEQTVVSNSWVELSMLMELYGQDAGYPTGLYGPQFTDPWLTTGYDAISFVQSQIIDVIQDDMDDALDFVVEEIIVIEPEVIAEAEPEVIAEPEPEVIIVIEPEVIIVIEPEVVVEVEQEVIVTEQEVVVEVEQEVVVEVEQEVVVIDAEEIFSNPVLSEILGVGNIVTVTLTETGTGNVIDSFQVNVHSENVTPLPIVDASTPDAGASSFELVDNIAPTEPMGFEEQPEMSVTEVEAATAELDSMESEPVAVEVSESEPEKEASSEDKAKSKKQRIVKKISTRVMATLSRNYEAAMQGAALSVMRMSAPTYKSAELQDLQDWYTPVEFDGGTNYDHPSALWITAQASEDMSDLVKMQWRK